MKIAIMQPYFSPYVGYFQLINSVDKFIFYDDVNYIKQGWINRNKILLNGKEYLLTLNLKGASSFKFINEINVVNDKKKILKTIHQAYIKAPYFENAYSLIEEILFYDETNLAKFISNSIIEISDYLGLATQFIVSSQLDKGNELKGQDKVINICKLLNADVYINAIGGQDLYAREAFVQEGVDLKFIKSKPIDYHQFDNNFIPNLSIIDVMMFNSKEVINKMLDNYELI